MGGQHDGGTAVALGAHEVPHGEPRLRVEPGAGLVEEQHVGSADQGARQGQALLLPSREPADRASPQVAETEELDQVGHGAGVGVQPRHVVEHVQGPRPGGQTTVLQDDAHAGTQRG